MKWLIRSSHSWVMLDPSTSTFVKLPNERVLFTSSPRITLEITSQLTPPQTLSFTAKCDNGLAYITNQRLIYLPTKPTTDFQSFSTPILKIQDACVRAPWFGANYWVATVRPVPGGNVPSHVPFVEVKMTFKEGGAYDFQNIFERVKEQLHHAVEIARESSGGSSVPASAGGNGDVDLSTVHLDQLPAYEAQNPSVTTEAATLGIQEDSFSPPAENISASVAVEELPPPLMTTTASLPVEPPPGYEEAQAQAVSINLDQRLREEAERQ